MQDGITAVVGLDVGDDWSHIYAVEAATGEVLEEGRVRTRREAIRAAFASRTPARVALEVGTHSRWMQALLLSLGHDVLVADARKLRMIWQGTNKQDRLDARSLAKVARLDPQLLHPVRHRGAQAQSDLSLIRVRDQLVRTRVKLVTMVRSMVKATGERLPRCATNRFAQRCRGEIPEALRDALGPVCTVVTELDGAITRLDERIEAAARVRYPQVWALTTVRGVAVLTAMAYILVLEDSARFARSRDVGPALGLVPRRDQSGATDRQLGITRTGDGLLRRLLVECAQHILRERSADSDLKRWGMAIAARGGGKAKRRAVVAVARKVAVLLHRLWVTQEDYVPLRNSAA